MLCGRTYLVPHWCQLTFQKLGELFLFIDLKIRNNLALGWRKVINKLSSTTHAARPRPRAKAKAPNSEKNAIVFNTCLIVNRF